MEHAKLLKVLADTKKITGRKKLQKMIYIAQKLHYPFYEKFEFHMYGPYSEELTLQMEELDHLGLVRVYKEESEELLFTMTEEGEAFLQQSNVELPSTWACMNCLNQQSARFLELVAALLYFGHLPIEQLRQKVAMLKRQPQYEQVEIDEAFHFIQALKERQFSLA
ncbi:YwgA family protein [Litoribacterium kuwaitense]|uniref:YwgA family protein n=1 Tax=Litoribacterium kuwaitense TaxID=1398745 RepID=UPI001BA4D1E6|nr:YwgA family protein [Litoribacterium kuwaitense]